MSWQPGCGNHNPTKKEESRVKKRNMMLATALLLVVLLIGGGTFAWFTASTLPKTNKFQAGTLKITLVDRFCEELAKNVNPGDCYYKEIYVKNEGTKRAVVRIKKDMAFDNPVLSLAPISSSIDSNWFEKNGYYIYKWVLDPGESTAGLFKYDKICFSGPLMGNEYQGQRFNIKVKAEAIQATHQAPWENGWGVLVYNDWVYKTAVEGEEVGEGEVREGTEADFQALLEAEGTAIGEKEAIDILDDAE